LLINYNDGWNDEFLIFQAKKELNLLSEEDKVNYQLWLKSVSKLAKRKNKSNSTPRRKRYNRNARLQKAMKWAEHYNGKNIAKG
jgi:hypothetical protein